MRGGWENAALWHAQVPPAIHAGQGAEVSTASSARRGEFDGRSLGNRGRWSWPCELRSKPIDTPLASVAWCALNEDTAAVMARGNAFAAAVSTAALPGYDQAHTDGLAPEAQFERSTVINSRGHRRSPRPAAGRRGQEP